MNRLAISLFILTAVGSLALLVMSIWPGVLSEAIFIGILVGTLPLATLMFIAVVMASIEFARGWRPGPLKPNGKRLLLAVPLILAAALSLLFTQLPCRIAFWSSRSALDAIAGKLDVTIDPGDSYAREALERRVGVYMVDEYGVDARGGIYFRVSTGPDGIGPDQMSYGFAKRPNAEGSPFGAAHYHLTHLSGDWYLFVASDDWFSD
jgi:hypothetical protein